jgi:hypothetical protein
MPIDKNMGRMSALFEVRLRFCRRATCIIPINDKPLLGIIKASYDIWPTNVSVKKWGRLMKNLLQFIYLFLKYITHSLRVLLRRMLRLLAALARFSAGRRFLAGKGQPS